MSSSRRERVAVVAGASRGLGLLISRELHAQGCRVHLLARDGDELDRAALGVDAQEASSVVTHVCDMRDADAVQRVIETIVTDEGRIDVAIHVAGIIQVGPLESLTLGHFHDAVDTMLWGPIHLSLAVLPAMRQAGCGRLGIVTSVGGVVSVPRLLPYSVAKFGAVGLAEGLAAELAGTGVTATAIVPGLMRTGGHLHAQFAGDAPSDYAWFSVGASLPVLSISADRAARKIVDGVLAGRPVVHLSALTVVGRRVHGLAPATTIRLMGVAARMLPAGPNRWDSGRSALSGETPTVTGATARSRLRSRAVEALTVLGTRAARRNNE